MKLEHRTRTWLGLLLSAVLFTAQGYSAEEKPNALATDVDVAWRRQMPKMDLGDNLPLAEVANLLGTKFPEVNFIVPENARSASVPRLVLRNVTLRDILDAMELVSEKHIRWFVPGTEPIAVDQTGLPIIPRATNSQGNLVTFIFTAPHDTVETRPPSPYVCRVFSLAPYLANRSEKDMTVAVQSLYSALETAWEMLKKYDRDVRTPTLKIHDGTKLLIAVGRDRELAVIEQVIKQLQGSASAKTVATPDELQPKPANTGAPPAAGNKL